MKQESLEKFIEEEIQGPYELPEGWKWVRLGEVSIINPSKKEITYLPDHLKVSFVPMDVVDEERGEIVNPMIRELGEVKKGYTYFKEADVIFAKITPCMENGKCAIAKNLANGLGFGSTEFHVVRANEKITPEWVWYYLRQKSIRDYATKYFTGSVGQQRVPKEFLENLQIPFPPLSEQKRIVAKIEQLFSKIDEIKRLRKSALEQAKALMPSALHQVFSKADEKGWRWVRLGEVVKLVKGKKPEKLEERNNENYLPYLTAQYMRNFEEPQYCEISNKVVIVNSNEIIIIMDGSYSGDVFIGFDGVLASTMAKFIFDSTLLVPKYLYFFLRDNFKILNAKTKGAATPHVRKDVLFNLQIPLPSLEEQKRIVAYLDRIQEKALKLQKLQEEMEREVEKLREAILYKAFRGQL